MNLPFFSGLAILAAAGAGLSAQVVTGPEVSVARWPGDRRAAISLTLDDGMETHLDVAAPILRKHGLHGTFFIITGSKPWQARQDEWRKLAADGNEMASHTIHHACFSALAGGLQDYTHEQMRTELVESARSVAALTGASRGLTFAYPCGDMTFGPDGAREGNRDLYQNDLAEYYFAARGAHESGIQNPDDLHRFNIPILGMSSGLDAPALIAMGEPAVKSGDWGVYIFHGVGGEWLPVSADAFDQLARWLAGQPAVWVATFGDGVRYTQERRALRLEQTLLSAGKITARMEWPLDAKIYDLPLTLKLTPAVAPLHASAAAAGRNLPVKIAGASILVDVMPGTLSVAISYR